MSSFQGNGAMVAILADPGYSMKEYFAFAIHLLFLKQRVTSMLDYATLLGKILMMCGLMREQYLLHTTSLEKKDLREYILKCWHSFGNNFVKMSWKSSDIGTSVHRMQEIGGMKMANLPPLTL